MKSFLRLLILVPLALIAAAFAVANRQTVVVSFDPFATDTPAFFLGGPLFLVLLIVVVLGVVLGGVGSWFSQGRHRRALRLANRDNDELRLELRRLKADLAGQPRPRNDNPSYPALPGRNAA